MLTAALVTESLRADPTQADKETAKDLYVAGMELREGGKHQAALKKFKAAYAILPTPITGLAVGAAHEALGQLVEARAAYARAAGLPVKPNESMESKTAREQAVKNVARLTQRLGTLTLVVSGLPAGKELTVLVDGRGLAVEDYADGIVVEPGNHRVTLRAVGLGEQTANVTVGVGETRSVSVSFTKASDGVSEGQSSKDATPPSTSTNPLVYWGVGVTAVGVGVATLAYARFTRLGGYIDQNCGYSSMDCPDQRSEQKTWGTTFYLVGIPLTLVGAAMSVYGLATPARTSPPKHIATPSSVRIVAAGTMLMVQGDF